MLSEHKRERALKVITRIAMSTGHGALRVSLTALHKNAQDSSKINTEKIKKTAAVDRLRKSFLRLQNATLHHAIC